MNTTTQQYNSKTSTDISIAHVGELTSDQRRAAIEAIKAEVKREQQSSQRDPFANLVKLGY